MAWAAVGVAAFQLISGAQQAEGIRANAKLSKQVADMNSEYAKIDAWKAEQDGLSQEARYQGVVQQLESKQNVANAVNNVDSNFGTAAEQKADTQLTGFLNALDIKNNAHKKALGYESESRNLKISGLMSEVQAKFNAGATQSASVLSAASTAASGYSKHEKSSSKSSGQTAWSDEGTGYEKDNS